MKDKFVIFKSYGKEKKLI